MLYEYSMSFLLYYMLFCSIVVVYIYVGVISLFCFDIRYMLFYFVYK